MGTPRFEGPLIPTITRAHGTYRAAFLAFFASFFSFMVLAGAFLVSFLALRSLPMITP